ncbi:MAG: EamA family transporter RarD [Kofleriaceae bacterium]
MDRGHRTGLLHGVLAYGLWGIVPVYWKLLAAIDPVELIAHRALWGLLAFVMIVVAARQWARFRASLRDVRVVAVMAVSGALLAVNWGVFVWATTSGHLLDASLGYFINPLVSVALGTIVLRERLRRLQWTAIALACAGVAAMTWQAGRVPFVALVLAGTFGAYGLVRKTARVDALVGSAIETLLIAPFAAGYLALAGTQTLASATTATLVLLIGTGVITAIPLVLFTSAARRLPLSTVGFLQYLAPTGQFLIAVLAFGEPLAAERLASFALIWLGLAAFSIDLVRTSRAAAARPRSTDDALPTTLTDDVGQVKPLP